jgi:hypothetical protein
LVFSQIVMGGLVNSQIVMGGLVNRKPSNALFLDTMIRPRIELNRLLALGSSLLAVLK